ncbi:hypothetical protein RJ640_022048 [Escallonia rubra]|uniref:Fe2OG dioxygenase domain-containing protein n=1 Tax=Escallonia rubra TaxID=112253 RepID=A0AA88U8U0_9ASTE|nr:hypothetical protein RJ640_022048 [Escallonia rubra]
MVATSATAVPPLFPSSYDRASELQAFDDTKAGVKGLVDAGVQKIPQIFVRPPESLDGVKPDTGRSEFRVPVVDLGDETHHREIVEKVRRASETCGFFQVVNHGIPVEVMEEMLQGLRRFYGQDAEVKKQYYTRDVTRKVVDIQIEYSDQVMKLGFSLFGLLSEALGLKPSHLTDMECANGLLFLGHCYPACPEPELTLGASKHTDDGFLTVLLQDRIGGLQIFHQNQWIDVPPVPGALVINIGDLLQAKRKTMAATETSYDRASELKAFDDTKTGVKGLVDAGISQVPRIFIQPLDQSEEPSEASRRKFSFPTIDLAGIRKDPVLHKEIVEKVREASETWGFFQVVNHGIATSVLDEMTDGARRFFEQDDEVKKQWYTRDNTKPVVYNSNFDLYSAPAANWRDTFYCSMAPKHPIAEELPETCREILMAYSKQVRELGSSLFELLAEGLGLEPDHLKNMDCNEGLAVLCHYYPECPQPELTWGTSKHADNAFITVLLQDQVGGLQILHENQWVDVPPLPGALVVNIGDYLQAKTVSLFPSSLDLSDHPEVIVKIDDSDQSTSKKSDNSCSGSNIRRESSYEFWKDGENGGGGGFNFPPAAAAEDPSSRLISQFLSRQRDSGGEMSLDVDLEMDEIDQVKVSFEPDIVEKRRKDSSSDDEMDEVRPQQYHTRRRSSNISFLISNDKYISAEHRVLANHIGPRISVACFFTTGVLPTSKLYAPIKELLSEDKLPNYRAITLKEYVEHYVAKGLDGTSALSHFRI